MRPVNALERLLVQTIRLRGPLSIAQWMRDALTHPQHGYYMKRDVFGPQGDFVTSPEVSAMFCQVVGSWVAHQWARMGHPHNLKLVELGPGRGTLMAGVLASLQREPRLAESGASVHMMEASPFLQELQRTALARTGAIGAAASWHTSISALPDDGPLLVLAHEYFDALPIFRFHYRADRGCWCEELVDVNDDPNGPPLRFVLSPEPTPATVVCLGRDVNAKPQHSHTIEVSPDSQSVMQVLADRMARHDPSAALLMDYGSLAVPSNSLRAIHNHKFVPLLSSCGESDLSADVDFGALQRVARQAGLCTSELATQRDFLEANGVDVLLTKTLRLAQSEETAQHTINSFQRIVKDMGVAYKVMAVGTRPELAQLD